MEGLGKRRPTKKALCWGWIESVRTGSGIGGGCQDAIARSINFFLVIPLGVGALQFHQWVEGLKAMALLNLQPFFSIHSFPSPKINSSSTITCFSTQSKSIEATAANSKQEYKPGVFDDIFLNVFRSKMAQEIGWDSEKPGYDGLIEVAHRIMND